jgi:hypothetical protein
MLQQRQLNTRANGMFGGPRMAYGQYIDQGIAQTSGTTYGGQGLGWYWDGYPNVTGGLTELDPQATMTGSNLSAAQSGQYYNSQTAIDAGLDGAPTGYSVGGTAAS